MKPILIEANLSPALRVSTQTDRKIKEPLMHAMLDVLNFPHNQDKLVDAMEPLFPFNEKVAEESKEIAESYSFEIAKKAKVMDGIIEETIKHYK